ncbi:MAG: DUF58 domain-containing protein [Treponema sp.]|nr:DUF58 domain-containing protein [Treponema sp.]
MRSFFGCTVTGLAVIVISLGMLVYSLFIRNAYEIFVFSVLIFIWAALFIAGFAGKRRLAAMEPQWKPPLPMTANTQEKTVVSGLAFSVPWFFRLHAAVKGRFFPAGSHASCRALVQAAVPLKSPSIEIDLTFPMSGVFQGKNAVFLRDIFGFFSFPCGSSQQRAFNVMNAPFENKPFQVDPQTGAEDRKNKSANDEERYYMREYTPGDRFRDINWKSSEKIDTLITRISPDTQEKVTRIEIYFRNYAAEPVSIDDLWLLDRAKARLMQFIRLLKESEKSYIFEVHTAQGSWELGDIQSIEDFMEDLAGFPFLAYNMESPAPSEGGMYVFSTACDRALPEFLLACHPRPISLFFFESGKKGKEFNAQILPLRNFFKAGSYPPFIWLFKRKTRELFVTASRIEHNYTGICL